MSPMAEERVPNSSRGRGPGQLTQVCPSTTSLPANFGRKSFFGPRGSSKLASSGQKTNKPRKTPSFCLKRRIDGESKKSSVDDEDGSGLAWDKPESESRSPSFASRLSTSGTRKLFLVGYRGISRGLNTFRRSRRKEPGGLKISKSDETIATSWNKKRTGRYASADAALDVHLATQRTGSGSGLLKELRRDCLDVEGDDSMVADDEVFSRVLPTSWRKSDSQLPAEDSSGEFRRHSSVDWGGWDDEDTGALAPVPSPNHKHKKVKATASLQCQMNQRGTSLRAPQSSSPRTVAQTQGKQRARPATIGQASKPVGSAGIHLRSSSPSPSMTDLTRGAQAATAASADNDEVVSDTEDAGGFASGWSDLSPEVASVEGVSGPSAMSDNGSYDNRAWGGWGSDGDDDGDCGTMDTSCRIPGSQGPGRASSQLSPRPATTSSRRTSTNSGAALAPSTTAPSASGNQAPCSIYTQVVLGTGPVAQALATPSPPARIVSECVYTKVVPKSAVPAVSRTSGPSAPAAGSSTNRSSKPSRPEEPETFESDDDEDPPSSIWRDASDGEVGGSVSTQDPALAESAVVANSSSSPKSWGGWGAESDDDDIAPCQPGEGGEAPALNSKSRRGPDADTAWNGGGSHDAAVNW